MIDECHLDIRKAIFIPKLSLLRFEDIHNVWKSTKKSQIKNLPKKHLESKSTGKFKCGETSCPELKGAIYVWFLSTVNEGTTFDT